jgi:predicted O-linked N-acetylglucosamine transferase (SPINDLY family)
MLSDQGRIQEAEKCYEKSLLTDPSQPFVKSNLLFALQYNPDRDAETVYREHLKFAERFAEPLYPAVLSYLNERTERRRLKIGYVSPDFRRHSVAYFIEPVLLAHKRDCVDVFCYSDVDKKDDFTTRLQGLADHWQDITGDPDERVAERVRRDKIDILVDLAGHTGHNRMLLFSRKPAPLQISWIGYPSTTGLSSIEYKLVDSYTDPPGMTEHYYRENLYRLPGSFLCYQPERTAPDVKSPPVCENGYITFGSFNNFAKVSKAILFVWIDLLKKIPASRLILKAKGFADEGTRRSLLRNFQQHGIAEERVELIAWIPSISDHLALYQKVDIALDTFPYHGTTTTCEALWMGVPVITLAGKNHASRVGVSILSNLGLQGLVAETPDDFIETAVHLAVHIVRLQELRKNLRGIMKRSLLTDADRFTENLEHAYRDMWAQWCQKH